MSPQSDIKAENSVRGKSVQNPVFTDFSSILLARRQRGAQGSPASDKRDKEGGRRYGDVPFCEPLTLKKTHNVCGRVGERGGSAMRGGFPPPLPVVSI